MIGSRARGNRAMHVLGAVDDLIMIIKADRCVVVFFYLFFFYFDFIIVAFMNDFLRSFEQNMF